jgi:hypothetical protein
VTGTSNLTGNATFGGTITVTGASSLRGGVTGPIAAATAFTIDNGNAAAINIGATTATAVNLGKATTPTAILGNGTVAGTLGVTGLATLSGGLNVTGGTVTLGSPTASIHLVSSDGVSPTLTAGPGVGTGTCTLGGNQSDTVGVININVGTGPANYAVVCTVTYNNAYTNFQSVVLFPTNAAAGDSYGNTLYVTTTATAFTINVAGAFLPASTTLSFQYIVIGR